LRAVTFFQFKNTLRFLLERKAKQTENDRYFWFSPCGVEGEYWGVEGEYCDGTEVGLYVADVGE
jgi:hypothetical protein